MITDLILYIVLIWAAYQIYKHLFRSSSTGCDKCVKKMGNKK